MLISDQITVLLQGPKHVLKVRSESANRQTEKGHLKMDTVRGDRRSKAAVLTIVDWAARLMATTNLESL